MDDEAMLCGNVRENGIYDPDGCCVESLVEHFLVSPAAGCQGAAHRQAGRVVGTPAAWRAW